MFAKRLQRQGEARWVIEPFDRMRAPVVVFADEELVREMDEQVYQQAANVASLPGIVTASYAMADAHWGYGFPIGGVAAFDPNEGGIISAGGVGFDISCGVRALRTGLTYDQIEGKGKDLADVLARHIPAGVGSEGRIKLSASQMDDMLLGGAVWAVEEGYGTRNDLKYIEEGGRVSDAEPRYVSDHAKQRQEKEVGTLGSGNHYLEVQRVTAIYDAEVAKVYGLALNDIMVMIHCGSRGLGHQIATDYAPRMIKAAAEHGLELADRELACAPIQSDVGRRYYGAMCAGINCALANREVLTHLTREAFARLFPQADLTLLYDVSHNTCKVEEHEIDGKPRRLYVHRKGATRAFGPGHPSLPEDLRAVGQPVLIGGTMGTASYILAGTNEGMSLSFGSCCHGAGRAMSRSQATKRWHGKDIVMHLAQKGIVIRGSSMRGIAEEAPGAYKDVSVVVDATEKAGLTRKVARLEPLACVKG
ncbi:MAG TPA: RtcB family protein [Sedimentisphaerales bacterium]|jgi:tRNA-splicing ligase RtcB|nr:RtcB family protein [Sedimentisphaerales bacterium]HNU27641.1 RtcB family protein [Sedimentisphaerales bacterium]